MDVDIVLGTIVDAIEDVTDAVSPGGESHLESRSSVSSASMRRYRVVSQGIGEVSMNDISIAHAAKGMVVVQFRIIVLVTYYSTYFPTSAIVCMI